MADELGLSRSHYSKIRNKKWPATMATKKLMRALCLLIDHGDGFAPKKGGKISL